MNRITRIDATRISVEVDYATGPGHVLIEHLDDGRITITSGSAEPFTIDRETWLGVVAGTATT